MQLFWVFTVNALIVGTVVVAHYHILNRLSILMPRLPLPHRSRLLVGVFVALAAHTLEVIFFALAFYLMHNEDGWGFLQGNFDGSFIDCIYYSFTAFTTLGFGDIAPLGNIRFLTVIESLTGLMMITWSASFFFVEMQRNWRDK